MFTNPDGTVELTWVNPTDLSAEHTLQIFRNQGSGFVAIDVLPHTQDLYHDEGVDANNQAIKYFIRVLGGDEVVSSPTVGTVFLQLNSSNLGSVANLSWTVPFDPVLPGGNFFLEKRVIPGGFETLAFLPGDANQYTDTMYAACGSALSIEYRIRFESTDCHIGSRVLAGEFQDLLGPPVPEVETILTDPTTGAVTLYWHPVSSPDLAQYVVQDINLATQTYVDVGFVPAGQPTEFTYTDAPLDGSTTFGVRAEDECGNEQNFNTTHTTMYAEVFHTACELTALVAWTPYTGWDEGVDEYAIYAAVDGAPPVEVGSVPEGELFYEAPVQPGKVHCFHVEARSNGIQRPSTSNGTCVTPDYPDVPDYFGIRHVSVTDENTIEIALDNDPNAEGVTYELFRSANQGPFRSLGITEGGNESVVVYTDVDVEVNDVEYTYYYEVVDGCGNSLGETNHAGNMVLHALADSSTVSNKLYWSGYGDWNAGVGQYEVLRALNSNDASNLFATVDSDILEFEENVESFRNDAGRFCYRIRAIENSNPAARSLSNTVCVVQPPSVWIPNSIVVGGFNDTFKPVAGFIDFSSYTMEIFGKWGNHIFQTTDIDEGWPGTYKGNTVRSDYYRYVISYRDGAGKPYTAQDVVYVLIK